MPVLLALPELAAVLVIFVLIALSYAYKYTLGATIEALAKALYSVSIPTFFFGHYRPFAFLATLLVQIDNGILYVIGKGIEANQWAFHVMVHAESLAWQGLSGALAEVAESTDRAFDYLVRHKIKALIAVATGGLSLTVPWLVTQVKWLMHELGKLPHALTRVIYHDVPHALTKAEEAAIAALVAVPKAIVAAGGIALPRFEWLEREATHLEKWVRAHARDFAPAAVVGLVAGVLFKTLDLGWLRCRGVGRVGKALCGLSGLIETIASDALEALVVADLCQVVSAMSYAAEKFEPVLFAFVDAENVLIGCHGYSAPDDLPLPRLSVPPVAALLAL